MLNRIPLARIGVDAKYMHMREATKISTGRPKLPRDLRVDALRGLALAMIFIDHIPGNLLSQITLRNFGFSDAAELFVLLSGFSSMVAYGGSFDRDGLAVGLRRVLLRCLRIYLFQAILLLVVLVMVGAWYEYFGLEPEHGAPYVSSGLNGLRHSLTLQAQPSALNVLPLYIVLLALFPLIYGLIRIGPIVALLASGAVWAVVNLYPAFNLTNWLDGGGWFFNPFAWQFLFVIGAVGAVLLRRYGGDLPRPLWLRAAAWGYLAFALVAAAPWDAWGWSSLHLIDVATPDKTTLAPLRLLDVLAFITLALGSARFRALVERPALWPLVVCGRHSLEVFSLGTVLAMLGHLVFRTYGVTVATQVLINGVGLGLMVVLALALERRRRPVATAGAPAQAGDLRVRTRDLRTGDLRTRDLRTRDVLRAPAMVENQLADRSAV
jgi:hypothetical protein